MVKKISYSIPLKSIWENLYRAQKNLTTEIPDDAHAYVEKGHKKRNVAIEVV